VRAAAVLALCVAAGCGTPASPCGATSARVANVVDGDTIDLDDGKRIRLLLVDTPETTNGKNDCYGQEAATFTRERLLGKTVTLTYESQCQDRFGRTLAFVAVDGKEINTELMSQGFACVLYIAPDGTGRKQEFEDLESVAKTNRTGLWGACAKVTCGN
jgi:micrococcal nuclease